MFGGGNASSSSANIFGGPSKPSTGFGGAFGGTNPNPSPFGGFQAASSTAFGGFQAASSTAFGSFGASSGAPSFGFNSNPQSGFSFNQPQSSTGFSGFGTGSTPGFGAFANKPNFFGSSNASGGSFMGGSGGFGGMGSFSGSSGAGLSGWGQPSPQGWPGQAASTKEQHEFQQQLARKDGRPLTPYTKFRDLQDGGQNVLHKIEQELGTCQKLSEELKENERLNNQVQLQRDFDAKVSKINQMISNAKKRVESDRGRLEELKPMEEWLHAATHDAGALCQRGQMWKSTKQELAVQRSLAYAHKDLSSLAELPNHHLSESVRELQEAAKKLSNWLSEMEAALGSGRNSGHSANSSDLEPTLLNMHTYFIHVASKIEKLYGKVEKAKNEYLKSLERQGIYSDPFAEADRECERRKNLLKKPTPSQIQTQNISSTLPSPMNQQNAHIQQPPASQGLNAAWGGFGASSGPAAGGLFAGNAGPSFGGGGMFGGQSTSSFFGQSSGAGLFGNSSAPSTFGGGMFGASSTATGFGAASSTGGLFGAAPTAGAFGANSSGTGLFGQSSGAAVGFGSGAGIFGQSSGASLFGQSTGAFGTGAGSTQFGQASTTSFASSGSFGGSMFVTPQRNKSKGGRRR